MAFGIESRVPFVDHLLVEWLATLPADMRLRDGWSKRILRDALVGILPEQVRRRKSKLGFATPDSEWLAGPLDNWLRNTLNDALYIADILDLRGVKQLLSRRAAGERSRVADRLLFRLAIYESWARQFLGSSGCTDPQYQKTNIPEFRDRLGQQDSTQTKGPEVVAPGSQSLREVFNE
jgi:asparagine synthase (glutamine-hydrolysing)